MAIALYGIRNCDTVKKARRFLDDAGVDYAFHDFKKVGLNRDTVTAWLEHLPVERLINKRGTTWRTLPPALREPLTTARAVELACDNPSLIKRPVVVWGADEITVGFDASQWTEHLAAHSQA